MFNIDLFSTKINIFNKMTDGSVNVFVSDACMQSPEDPNNKVCMIAIQNNGLSELEGVKWFGSCIPNGENKLTCNFDMIKTDKNLTF